MLFLRRNWNPDVKLVFLIVDLFPNLGFCCNRRSDCEKDQIEAERDFVSSVGRI